MCESYGRALLRVAVAQICQALGWDSVQLTACDILTDVLNRYMEQLSHGCHRYSELYGRTDPVLDDLGQAFKLMGISLSELEDYIHNLEPIGFAHQIPTFPVSKNNVLQFPQPGAKRLGEEKEYIPEYMPPLISSQEEEEEEQVPTDGGTSAEAMQVPLEEEEEEMEEEEAVNDENILGKRPLESPDSVDLPVAKRARTAGCKTESPEGVLEPREPLSMINSQRVPPVLSPVPPPDHSDSLPLSPEPPMLAPIPKPSQLSTPKTSDSKAFTSKVKSKILSSSTQKPKSPKGAHLALLGSPIRSPKASLKTDKKSPMRTKSPKSPKSPKVPPNVSHSIAKNEMPNRTPLSVCNSGLEKLGKENIQTKQQSHTSIEVEKPTLSDTSPKKLPVPDKSIDDSIDAVIARACAEREPDPFEFSSGSESEGEIFTSPRRLTISESSTPRMFSLSSSFSRGSATPVSSSAPTTSTNVSWTLDDSINEVVRKASMGTPPSVPASVPYLSSPSASPPTPEPLLKLYEERTKHTSSSDVKKKLKKEIKMKIKKKEKEKLKEKDKEKKEKGKDKEKNKEKEKEANKESKVFKELPKDHEADPFKFRLKDDIKAKHKDGNTKKDKEKHKEKKKEKEKGKKDKEKNKDKDKHKVKNALAPIPFVPKEPLFSTPSSVRSPSVLPTVPPMAPERLFEEKSKEKDKKKDKKEKKKKKDKDKDRMKEKEKKEKEKKEKEKEKEKEKDKHKHEKAKPETNIPAPSPVIPRLTLRVGAGQDKIVISKVVPVSEAKPSPPAGHPKTPPPPSPAPLSAHMAPALTPAPLPPPTAVPSPVPALPIASPAATCSAAGASKTPVRSVVTETVSTYVIRDEWGNQIWICPGCNKPDDGSPMIGCDDCDDWYHWPCVGISAAPPDEVQWFCPKCINKKKEKKHKRKKSRAH
ncbi:transcription initiation factor TFIID subunit 3 [Mobula birostris]|uniref:transcription initiation factor TFIID subunit 3 n=1 Tax=Mobula birostris TaxID=1983395 RepID=UPI003B2840FA